MQMKRGTKLAASVHLNGGDGRPANSASSPFVSPVRLGRLEVSPRSDRAADGGEETFHARAQGGRGDGDDDADQRDEEAVLAGRLHA